MDYVRLGRTGLEVSVAGLGCGGHSRLGLGQGKSLDNALAILDRAMERGVTLIDTAQVYGTESAVGTAIAGRRDKVVISTKGQVTAPGASALGSDYRTADQLRQGIEQSLKALETDHIDIFHLHGVMPHQYVACLERFLPLLEGLRADGKIRYFGLTERFIHDPGHEMLQIAVKDPYWDVIMVGFNMINQCARDRVLPQAIKADIGVLCMFAVRNFLSSRKAAARLMRQLAKDGALDENIDPDHALDFVVGSNGARTLIEAAYRYCRHETGIDVVLTGTGNPDHLQENLDHLALAPLPDAIVDRLAASFGHIDHVSGE